MRGRLFSTTELGHVPLELHGLRLLLWVGLPRFTYYIIGTLSQCLIVSSYGFDSFQLWKVSFG